MTPSEMLTFLNANKTILTPVGADDIQSDGFIVTGHLCNLLLAPNGIVANPIPQSQIPKPFGIADILGLVSSNNQAKVRDCPSVSGIQEAILANDRAAVGNWAALCAAGSLPLISGSEEAAIIGVLTATIPDPSWQASVRGPTLLSSSSFSGDTHTALPILINQALGRTL